MPPDKGLDATSIELLRSIATRFEETCCNLGENLDELKVVLSKLEGRVKRLEAKDATANTRRSMLVWFGGIVVTVATGIWGLIGNEILAEFKHQREVFKAIERRVQ
jgi:hypothetical protein